MDYIIIIILQIIGVGFHVGQKIVGLGDKFPEKTKREIFAVFWKEDWDTLGVSVFVLMLNLVAHFVTCRYLPVVADWEYFEVSSFAVALILGYAGQRKIYKWLGSAEQFLDKKIEEKLK